MLAMLVVYVWKELNRHIFIDEFLDVDQVILLLLAHERLQQAAPSNKSQPYLVASPVASDLSSVLCKGVEPPPS